MRRRLRWLAIGLLLGAALSVAGIAIAAGSPSPPGATSSRLDEGKALLSKAKISVEEAIAAARAAAPGSPSEVDLEYEDQRLVFDVEVRRVHVRVDAIAGRVVGIDNDDAEDATGAQGDREDNGGEARERVTADETAAEESAFPRSRSPDDRADDQDAERERDAG